MVVSVKPARARSAAAVREAPSRKFLWTLQQERRPPRQGAWLLYEVLAVDKAIEKTI